MNYPRYTIVFLVVAVGTALLVMALNQATQSVLGSSAQVLVPAMIAALIEGQQFTRNERRKPNTSEAWSFAWIATGIAVVLNLLLTFAAVTILPEFGKLAIAPVMSVQFFAVLGLYAVGYLICNRFFVGLGAGNELSAIARRNEPKE